MLKGFILIPHYQDTDLTPGSVGSAVFTSILPFHVAVDQVKYSTGEAMSYVATASGTGKKWPGLNNTYLMMPLIQKGNASTGLGDTSGLQLFNAWKEVVHLAVSFYGSSGQLIEPTKFGPFPITLGAFANATIKRQRP